MKICVLGGTGFVGRCLVERLTALGHEVLVPTRNREAHRDLLVLPGIRLVPGDFREPHALRRQLSGMDAVINLIGILNEERSGDFARAHVDIPRRLVEACEVAKVQRLVHVSALNAAADAPSRYLRSKGQGEVAVAASSLSTTIFRPSVLFGRGDAFTTRFAAWLRRVPGIFPLARAGTRIAPLHVADLVRAVSGSLTAHQTFGGSYDLCGPQVYTLKAWVEYIALLEGIRVRVMPLGDRLSRIQASLLEHLPGRPLTRDNCRTLLCDAVCPGPWPALFAPLPRTPESILPSYIGSKM